MLRQRVFIPGKTFNAGGGIHRAGKESNLLMPGVYQLCHGVKTGLFMIAPDAMAAVFAQAAIKHHYRLTVRVNDVIDLIHA